MEVQDVVEVEVDSGGSRLGHKVSEPGQNLQI